MCQTFWSIKLWANICSTSGTRCAALLKVKLNVVFNNRICYLSFAADSRKHQKPPWAKRDVLGVRLLNWKLHSPGDAFSLIAIDVVECVFYRFHLKRLPRLEAMLRLLCIYGIWIIIQSYQIWFNFHPMAEGCNAELGSVVFRTLNRLALVETLKVSRWRSIYFSETIAHQTRRLIDYTSSLKMCYGKQK